MDVSSWKLACLEWKHHLDVIDIPGSIGYVAFVAICLESSCMDASSRTLTLVTKLRLYNVYIIPVPQMECDRSVETTS